MKSAKDYPGLKLVQCKSCGEMISFITTAKGAQMPINPDKKVTVITLFGEIITGFIPHWSTCPGADKFRKGGS